MNNFLLGGHDLEMMTIKSLLENKQQVFYDRNLIWSNANLSAYKEVFFNSADNFYGIELFSDVDPPVHYVRIDHHNDMLGCKSSLRQVAEVLGVELNRHQLLVEANDVAYIDGMLKIGASRDEIEEIRIADRKLQGVTDSEEQIAAEEVAKAQSEGNLIVVDTVLTHFSPLVDRLYPCSHLLVSNSNELTYYGNKTLLLANVFNKEVNLHKAYYGGLNGGFFGIAQNAYSAVELLKVKSKIIELVNNDL